jgi:hypothetical protein
MFQYSKDSLLGKRANDKESVDSIVIAKMLRKQSIFSRIKE